MATASSDPIGYTDVTSSGVRVHCPFGAGQPAVVVFGTDAPLALPSRGLYVSAEFIAAAGTEYAVVAPQDEGDQAWLVRRAGGRVGLGPVNGQYPVLITRAGRVFTMPSFGRDAPENGTIYHEHDLTGRLVDTRPCARTSQGFAGVDASGLPLWMQAGVQTLFGVAINRPYYDGNWFTCLDNHVDRVLVCNMVLPTPQWYIARAVATPIGARLRLGPDGTPTVAISIPGGFVTRAEFTPTTVEVLRASATAPASPAPPSQPPSPPPPPSEVPPMPAFPDTGPVLSLLNLYRADYGAGLSNDDCVALLNRVAYTLREAGWGLLRKDAGNHGTRSDGVNCSVDWLTHLPSAQGFDALASAGGGDVSTPTVGDVETFDTSLYVAPIAPAAASTTGSVPPPPPPPTDPPPTATIDVAAAIALVQATHDVVQQTYALVEGLHDLLATIVATLPESTPGAPAAPTAPAYSGTIAIPLLGSVKVHLTPDSTT